MSNVVKLNKSKKQDNVNNSEVQELLNYIITKDKNNDMSAETVKFLNAIKNNDIPNVLFFRVDTMKPQEQYHILSVNRDDITKLSRSGFISQLKSYFDRMYNGKGVFNPKHQLIDSYITPITTITSNIYEDVGLYVNDDDLKSRYNYYVLSKTERRLKDKVANIKKRDLEVVYKERRHLFTHVDFLIKNMLDVDNFDNLPKNKEHTGDLLMFFLNHLNFCLQYKEKATKAFFIISEQGTGKGLFSEILKSFYGKSFDVLKTEIFTGTGFNSQVIGLRMSTIEEITTLPRERADISTKLKSFITDEKERVREMYKDVKTTKQINNTYLFTNLNGQIVIEPNCRRYNVISGTKILFEEAKKAFHYTDINDFQEKFIPAYFSEISDFLETLLLSSVNVGKAKNITIINEAKNNEIKKTTDRKDYLKRIIKNADMEELENYFYDYKDDETFKVMKAQIYSGFLDNNSSTFLFKVLCEYNYKNEQNFKQNDYLDSIIGSRIKSKYDKLDGVKTSSQIRPLPHYKPKSFQRYMKLNQEFNEFKDSVGVDILNTDDFVEIVLSGEDVCFQKVVDMKVGAICETKEEVKEVEIKKEESAEEKLERIKKEMLKKYNLNIDEI